MFLIRLIIVGETGVGKTSLLVRFNEDNFYSNQKTTIGVDYKAKEILIDNTNVKLQIWDTAGQERFRAMTSAFYNKAQGVVVTFDVTQYDSFTALGTWIKDVKQHAPPGVVIILCANKADIREELWKVRREEFTQFAQENGYRLFETSAASGMHIQELFMELGSQILANSKSNLHQVKDETGTEENLILFDLPKKKKKRCCTIS